MARPVKDGLDYFPFDVQFFDDEKIVAVAVKYGIKGEMCAVKLLCSIYRKGYYIEWNRIARILLLKSLPGVTEDELDEIVNRLVEWGFFDKSLFDTAKVLTSVGIQERYFKAKRWKTPRNKEHLLLTF